MYACHGEMDDDVHGVAWDCLNDWMPEQENCYTSMFIWAVGGTVRFFNKICYGNMQALQRMDYLS